MRRKPPLICLLITRFFFHHSACWFKKLVNGFEEFENFLAEFGPAFVKKLLNSSNSFVISRHNQSMLLQFIDKFCLVLQQNDSFIKRHTPLPLRYCLFWRDTHLFLCDIAYFEETHTSSSAILPILMKTIIVW